MSMTPSDRWFRSGEAELNISNLSSPIFFFEVFFLVPFFPLFLHFSSMICLSGAVKYCVHNYVEYHFMSCNCVIHLSLKLFPMGSVLVLIVLEEKPIYCSYFFFGGKKFSMDEFLWRLMCALIF